MAPEDVAVMSSNGHGERRICGFLTGQRDVAGWELFTGHRHPCPADGSIKVGAPRLPPLSSGELVDTVREVWCPDARSSCTRAVGAPLVAIVQQWCNAGRKQRRSYAVVGLPGGRLAWARLFGVGSSKTGLLVPSTPPASAPADEFAALENVLPDFLARYTVDGVNNKLRHPGYTGGIHRPRPAVPTQLGPCQVDFSQDDVFELIVTKHFEPVVNLKAPGNSTSKNRSSTRRKRRRSSTHHPSGSPQASHRGQAHSRCLALSMPTRRHTNLGRPTRPSESDARAASDLDPVTECVS